MKSKTKKPKKTKVIKPTTQELLRAAAEEISRHIVELVSNLGPPEEPYPADIYPAPVYYRPTPRSLEFRQSVPKPFMWLTHGGELKRLSEMPTPHLYYALRMVWNHGVPADFRTPESIHPVKLYSDVPKWSSQYREAAIIEFARELNTRNLNVELTPAMRDGLMWIKLATHFLKTTCV